MHTTNEHVTDIIVIVRLLVGDIGPVLGMGGSIGKTDLFFSFQLNSHCAAVHTRKEALYCHADLHCS